VSVSASCDSDKGSSADAFYIQWQRFGNHRSNKVTPGDTTVALSPNFTYTICCGFAVQQAVDLSWICCRFVENPVDLLWICCTVCCTTNPQQIVHNYYFTMTDIHAAATLFDSRPRNNTDVVTSDLKTRGISTLRTSKNDDRMCADEQDENDDQDASQVCVDAGLGCGWE